ADRQEELEKEAVGKVTHQKEFRQTRVMTSALVGVAALGGIWLGAALNARRSTQDRNFIDWKMYLLIENQRQMQEQLFELHKSNRKIAFWTEKTPDQIDKEMAETRDGL